MLFLLFGPSLRDLPLSLRVLLPSRHSKSTPKSFLESVKVIATVLVRGEVETEDGEVSDRCGRELEFWEMLEMGKGIEGPVREDGQGARSDDEQDIAEEKKGVGDVVSSL